MRIRSRRSAALLVSLAMTAGVLAFASPASAEIEQPPGPITFTAVDGVIKVGDADGTGLVLPLSCDPDPGLLPEFPGIVIEEPEDCDPDEPAPELSGTFTSDGGITIDTIAFPPGEPAPVPDLGGFVTMNVVAAGPATGEIAPSADGDGSLELNVSLAVNVVLDNVLGGLLNGVCDVPLELSMSGVYDQNTGIAVIADSDFAVVIDPGPETPSCDPAGLASAVPTITGSMASGNNVVRFVLEVDPVITQAIPVGPPTVNDTDATIALGGSATRPITSLANPAQTCALVGDNGGATLGTASVSGFQVSYTHDAAEGAGVDTVDYQCTNTEGTDTGTLTVTILGNECEAGPAQGDAEEPIPAPGCSLDQFIEFEIEGAELSMSQDEANVTLGTITLNGAPQTTTGDLNTVTVVNKRGDGQEWDLSGQVSDFQTQGYDDGCPVPVGWQPSDGPQAGWDYRCVPGDNLGWSPAAEVAHQVVPGDVAAVTAGSAISASDIAAGDLAGSGLGSSAHTLCSAAETTSGGTFACGAGLALVVPASAAAGTYNATLTLTLS